MLERGKQGCASRLLTFRGDKAHVHLEQGELAWAVEQGFCARWGGDERVGPRDAGLSLLIQMDLVPGARDFGVFKKPTLAILRNSKESKGAGP